MTEDREEKRGRKRKERMVVIDGRKKWYKFYFLFIFKKMKNPNTA